MWVTLSNTQSTPLTSIQRLQKGYAFQDFVKFLLSKSGYLEGQIYSTGTGMEVDYWKRLQKRKLLSYTSPDVLILNKWMVDAPQVEFKFGLSCSRRDTMWHSSKDNYLTLPTYQRKRLVETTEEKKLTIYLAFGAMRDSTWHVGVTKLKEPEGGTITIPDQSTGKTRYYDLYSPRKTLSWAKFMELRQKGGDVEPDFRFINSLKVKWIGPLK